MHSFELRDIAVRQAASDRLYLEFLRIPAITMGLYVLPAGGVDPQKPHSEDEVYYVVSGRAMIQVGTEQRKVAAGSIIYVPRKLEHRFHSIEEDLQVLVFFAPAEYSLAHDGPPV